MTLLKLTADITAAYVESNRLDASEIPNLVRSVYTALTMLGQPEATAEDAPKKLSAAQVRRSIRPEALISFEDGKPYRLLKRHLGAVGLTPQTYREKWGLGADYPMVAPEYAAKRSELAKASGLGQQRQQAKAKGAPKKTRARK